MGSEGGFHGCLSISRVEILSDLYGTLNDNLATDPMKELGDTWRWCHCFFGIASTGQGAETIQVKKLEAT